jgi:hypothetical protein
MKDYCRHWPGREYDVADATGKSAKRRCKMLLHGAKEAYELSFVAVPAQPRAGTHKSIGFTKPVEEKITEEIDTQVIENETKTKEKDLEIALKMRVSESFIFAENQED